MKTKDACFWVDFRWTEANLKKADELQSGNSSCRPKCAKALQKIGLNPDQMGKRWLRGSTWTGESHEIRSISECNGLVFFPEFRLFSRKAPEFSDFLCDVFYALSTV